MPGAKTRSTTTRAATAGPGRSPSDGNLTAAGPDHGPRADQDRSQGQLRAKHTELGAGIRTPARYTVEQCLQDWLETLSTQSQSTVTGCQITVRHLTGLIGNVKLADLKVRDVQFALGKLAERLSTRSVRLARMILIQATRNAMANDMLGGIRTEEARALHWSEVDLEAGTVAVYRSVRRTGETKTEKSRRVFQIPEIAVAALRDLVLKQAAARARAGAAWKENDRVFCTSLGGPMYATDVRMEFKRITEKAGLGRLASSLTIG